MSRTTITIVITPNEAFSHQKHTIYMSIDAGLYFGDKDCFDKFKDYINSLGWDEKIGGLIDKWS